MVSAIQLSGPLPTSLQAMRAVPGARHAQPAAGAAAGGHFEPAMDRSVRPFLVNMWVRAVFLRLRERGGKEVGKSLWDSQRHLGGIGSGVIWKVSLPCFLWRKLFADVLMWQREGV